VDDLLDQVLGGTRLAVELPSGFPALCEAHVIFREAGHFFLFFELEAVEMFVEMMANLAHLEEKEEMTRFSEDHVGLAKRWEARRELHGKPRPPKHLVQKVVHQKPNVAKFRIWWSLIWSATTRASRNTV
jgi:hypothetical protein